jgi:cell division protein ZapA (FtsZ GTPase activity inhibitor)
MNRIHSHRVSILGREYQVKSPVSPEKVSEIEQFVNERLEVVSSAVAVGDVQAAVSLAMLNLAGEYLTVLEELRAVRNEHANRLDCLVRRVDDGMK